MGAILGFLAADALSAEGCVREGGGGGFSTGGVS